jgi:hypothetical protein
MNQPTSTRARHDAQPTDNTAASIGATRCIADRREMINATAPPPEQKPQHVTSEEEV